MTIHVDIAIDPMVLSTASDYMTDCNFSVSLLSKNNLCLKFVGLCMMQSFILNTYFLIKVREERDMLKV